MSEKTKRYINPLTDFGFKHFFATESNKEILLKFLNAVFEDKKQIEDVIIMPFQNRNKKGKSLTSELLCKEENGKQFTVTIQRIEEEIFRGSSGKFIVNFLKEAESGKPDPDQPLREQYVLGLADFIFGDHKDMYYREIHFTKVDSKQNPAGSMGLIFMEIPGFQKNGKELDTELDKWFYLLKHLRYLEEIPKHLREESFVKIFQAAEVSALTSEQQASYFAELSKRKSLFRFYDPDQAAADAMQKQRNSGQMDKAAEEIFLEFFKKGYETGFKEGMMEIAAELGTMF